MVSLIQTLPYFSPSNIFVVTNSRLQIPPNTLFNRLNNIRNGELTTVERALKQRYSEAPTDFALLYATYGPDALAYCPFCRTGDPSTYLLYSLPSMLAPHLLHVFLLGLMTSSVVSGKEGSRWRLYATVVGVLLAATELAVILRYDWKLNTLNKTLKDAEFLYWKLRTGRLLSFALVDLLLGWALWLTSTNRWLVQPPSISDQLRQSSMVLQSLHNKLFTLGLLQNTVMRDEHLRGVGYEYWTREPRMMEEIEQQREVIDARRIAISRMNYDKVQQDAGIFVDKVWNALQDSRQQPVGRPHAD